MNTNIVASVVHKNLFSVQLLIDDHCGSEMIIILGGGEWGAVHRCVGKSVIGLGYYYERTEFLVFMRVCVCLYAERNESIKRLLPGSSSNHRRLYWWECIQETITKT